MTTITFTYTWSKWDEGALDAFALSSPTPSALKFVKIASDRVFTGDFTGTGWDESVMVYHPTPAGEYSATYAGLVHVQGELQGEKGEAVFTVEGVYTDAEGPVSEWRLDERSTSGAWEGKKAVGGDRRMEGDKRVMQVVLRVHDA